MLSDSRIGLDDRKLRKVVRSLLSTIAVFCSVMAL